MRRAMARAEVGDDVYGEDPTVRALEELAASLVGKEAALFVPSGTMGNQAAVLTHTARGDEVVVEQEAHIYWYEAGGMALLSGVQVRPLRGERGALDPQDVEAAIRPADVHFPRTSLVCLENTHNRAGGTVWPSDRLDAVCRVAHGSDCAVHLDGARIFNAQIATGTSAARLAAGADSVMFCLSKGLAAPVGSILAGSHDFIGRARKSRKVLGGAMRQAGMMAAAGIVALRTMVDRLAEDHEQARRLAEGLAVVPGLQVDPRQVETNMVMVGLKGSGADFCRALAGRGVKAGLMDRHRVRLVTHKDVAREDIDYAVAAIAAVAGGG
ncbi:MAG: GntG family PLP-dependent aldolase [bacterium]|nr:GntG family PLP-dependent aldolase [bacterium]